VRGVVDLAEVPAFVERRFVYECEIWCEIRHVQLAGQLREDDRLVIPAVPLGYQANLGDALVPGLRADHGRDRLRDSGH
jgi:hypothetical protein